MLCALTLLVAQVQSGVQNVEIDVDGVKRTAWIYLPADSRPAPVIFAFHGHGGNQNYSLRRFGFDKSMPDCISVYPQGLPSKGITDPEGTKNGWQQKIGDQGDRDLKFTDALLKWVKDHHAVDTKHIFAMGHSNGAAFTFVLWGSRGDVFSAFAPCSAPATGRVRTVGMKPAMYTYGTKDTIVNPRSMNLTLSVLTRLNGGGEFVSDGPIQKQKGGVLFWTYVFDGGHQLPEDSMTYVAKFFREVLKAEASRHPLTTQS